MVTTRMGRMVRALVLAVVLAVTGGQAVHAQNQAGGAAQTALAWLLTRQQSDGSFPGFDAGASADAIFAIAASGTDPKTIQKGGKSALSYLETQAATYAAKSTAAAGKLSLAVTAAGGNPSAFGSQNLVDLLNKSYSAQSKLYGANPTDHAYAVLALAGAGQTVAADAVAGFAATQLADGGWSYDGAAATGSDTNTTSLALQALAAIKASGDPVAKAVAYLKTQQNADGGFPYAKTSAAPSDSDANSTAVVIQGLAAAGQNVATLTQGSNTPLTALAGFQNPSGAFRYQNAVPEDNDLATAQAVPALLLKSLPIAAAAAPANAPATLPTTGSEPMPVWVLVPALVLVLIGFGIRRKV